MECDKVREALSAILDGEEPGVDPVRVDEHVASCAGCRAWREEATRLDRLARLTPVHDPGLARRVLAHAGRPPRRPWRGIVTVALVVVAVAQVLVGCVSMAMPLGMGEAMMASVHMDHESGAFNLAFGVALFVVSLNTRRSRTILPMLVVFVGVLGVASVFDLADGQVNLARLATHLPIVVGLALTATLAEMTRRDPEPDVGAVRDGVGSDGPALGVAEPDVDSGRRPEQGSPPAARRDVA